MKSMLVSFNIIKAPDGGKSGILSFPDLNPEERSWPNNFLFHFSVLLSCIELKAHPNPGLWVTWGGALSVFAKT